VTEEQRDDAAVSAFVERFSSVLVDGGFQRMAARVFVTLLASESAALTAAELAGRLRVSPAAISGAVRYLLQLELVSRDREPGSRRDIFRVDNDVWANVVERQMQRLVKWRAHLAAGVTAVGSGTPAALRLADMAEFFDFIDEQMPDMLQGWRERRKT